jgi:nuclear pore complex protein Nup98-Nup96
MVTNNSSLLTGSTPAPATGGFGQPATSTFGQQPGAATGGFGQPAANTTGAFGGFGQKPATTPATGGFGGFGTTGATTGGFGTTPGAFGAAASKPASSFSFGATAPTTGATTGFGGFGSTSAPAAGGFGQAATGAAGTGLFGAAKPAAPTTSLFGNTTGATTGTTTGFGGFGTGQTGATGGLFGQKPATGGLGGTGGGLFGNPAGTTTGGFGGFGQQQGSNTFSLPATGGLTSFGTNPLQPGMQQQPLVATVDKNPYGNNPLFDLSKASSTSTGAKLGPSAVAVDGTSRKASNAHYPISPRVVSKIKLRGFSFTPTSKASTRTATSDLALNGISDDAVLGSGAFAPRPNNKRLVFDDNVDTADIVALVNSGKNSDAKRRSLFDPRLEYIAAKENTNPTSSTTTAPKELDAPAPASSSTTNPTINLSSASSVSSIAMKNGYYISPTLETLASTPKEGLKNVRNLVVGRKGYGEIKFDQPVDLSEIVLEDIMGVLVVLEEHTAVIYPDNATKPAKGTQLNVPATIKLENCFIRDKNTGAPIKDPAHPRFQHFKEKLRKQAGKDFVGYEDDTGTWTFKVVGF